MIETSYKTQFVRNMSGNSGSNSPVNGLVKRRANMDRIRGSMQNFNLLRKNKAMAENKLLEKKHSSTSKDDALSSSPELQNVPNDKCRVQLFQEKFELMEKLGQGASGVVRKCKRKNDGKELAVKSFRFEEQHLPSLKANFMVMKNLRHPNIVSYESLYFDIKKRMAWLVMELCQGKDITLSVRTEEEIKEVMWQVLDALSYLHRHDVVHRDIKPENILYDPSTKKIKIIDFGISKRFRRRGALFDMWTITGTLYYRAPEMFSGGYREGVDVWAAGILLYKLVCGQTPFESVYHSETIQNITGADLKFPEVFKNFNPDLKSLISGMLQRNIDQRFTINGCMKNNWFSGLITLNQFNTLRIRNGNLSVVIENPLIKYPSNFSLKPGFSLRDFEEDSFKLIKATSTLTSGHPYVRKVHGGDYHVIDQDWQ